MNINYWIYASPNKKKTIKAYDYLLMANDYCIGEINSLEDALILRRDLKLEITRFKINHG